MVQGACPLSFPIESALGMPSRMRGQEQNLFYAVITRFSQFVPERSRTPASLQCRGVSTELRDSTCLLKTLLQSVVIIPKAMEYAMIAGLPVQVGLYTALVNQEEGHVGGPAPFFRGDWYTYGSAFEKSKPPSQ
jgi:Sulfate permease family